MLRSLLCQSWPTPNPVLGSPAAFEGQVVDKADAPDNRQVRIMPSSSVLVRCLQLVQGDHRFFLLFGRRFWLLLHLSRKLGLRKGRTRRAGRAIRCQTDRMASSVLRRGQCAFRAGYRRACKTRTGFPAPWKPAASGRRAHLV